MNAWHWLEETIEYVVGAAVVLTHLALAGRFPALIEARPPPTRPAPRSLP